MIDIIGAFSAVAGMLLAYVAIAGYRSNREKNDCDNNSCCCSRK